MKLQKDDNHIINIINWSSSEFNLQKWIWDHPYDYSAKQQYTSNQWRVEAQLLTSQVTLN